MDFELMKFLNNNNVLLSYQLNAMYQKGFISTDLLSAFIWESSPEGEEYWNNLYVQYYESVTESITPASSTVTVFPNGSTFYIGGIYC
jgi:hypothetical protein